MATIAKPPCDEAVILASVSDPPCAGSGSWVPTATILESSMAFIDGTVVNVALPALQSVLHAQSGMAGTQAHVQRFDHIGASKLNAQAIR